MFRRPAPGRGAEAFDVARTHTFGTYDGNPLPPNADDVRNAPIVVQMDDDDCDGRVTGRDIPEVVFAVSPDNRRAARRRIHRRPWGACRSLRCGHSEV